MKKIIPLRNSSIFDLGKKFCVFLNRKANLRMASGTTLLNKTAMNSRQELISQAEIKSIEDISPSVKELQLHVKDIAFFFKAGQWVDMFIPGVSTVGGFSMSSAPHRLAQHQRLSLAIKAARHPPAHWVHSQCKVGDMVAIRAGGDFFYDPSPESFNEDVLLLAGGVGINPLYSILQHFAYLNQLYDKSSNKPNATMLYSAKTTDELIFKNELKMLCSSNQNITVKMHCTREKVSHYKDARISKNDLDLASKDFNREKTRIYICGPEPFITAMETYSLALGFKKSSIIYEKWW